MAKPYDPADDSDPVAPECRATADAIQRVLDGVAAPETLDADPHAGACPACRERLRAARVLLAVLAAPGDPVPVPAAFTDRVLSAVRADRTASVRRRRMLSVAGVLALAAAVLVGAWVIIDTNPVPAPERPKEVVRQPVPVPDVPPAPREKAPAPPPIRIGAEFARAGQAFRDAPKPIADSVAIAPKLLDALTGPFTTPAAPAPMGDALEPARRTLADLPDAARSGLEPVTGTAQKAFDRLLRDVASVKPKS